MHDYVTEPMAFGRLYLAGDAAHLVAPIAAKGLNLALHDAFALGDALVARLLKGDGSGLDGYSEGCLRRVWDYQEFSQWLAELYHGARRAIRSVRAPPWLAAPSVQLEGRRGGLRGAVPGHGRAVLTPARPAPNGSGGGLAQPSRTTAPGSSANALPGTSSFPRRRPLPTSTYGRSTTAASTSTGQLSGSPTG